MSNTIGWGQGAVNNNIDYGQGPKIEKGVSDFGKSCYSSNSPETNLTGEATGGGGLISTKAMTNDSASVNSLGFVSDDVMTGLGGLSNFSFTTWVYISSTLQPANTIASSYTGSDEIFSIVVRDGKGIPDIVVSINGFQLFICLVPVNTWVNITYAMNTTKGQPLTSEMWFDNVPQTNQTLIPFTTTSSVLSPCYLLQDANQTAQGFIKMNQIAFFNATISQAMVSQIYATGCPIDFSSLNPVVYIRDLESATYDGIKWSATDIGSLATTFRSLNPNGIITDSPCP